MQQVIAELDAFPDTVKNAVMTANTPQEMVDIIGTIKSVERRYKPIVSSAVSETKPDAGETIQGERHRVEVGAQATRTYNTPRLMSKFQEAGVTFLDLIEHGVIEIKWRWTDLTRYAKNHGITLDKVNREIAPMSTNEEADIGEIWGETYPRWN